MLVFQPAQLAYCNLEFRQTTCKQELNTIVPNVFFFVWSVIMFVIPSKENNEQIKSNL